MPGLNKRKRKRNQENKSPSQRNNKKRKTKSVNACSSLPFKQDIEDAQKIANAISEVTNLCGDLCAEIAVYTIGNFHHCDHCGDNMHLTRGQKTNWKSSQYVRKQFDFAYCKKSGKAWCSKCQDDVTILKYCWDNECKLLTYIHDTVSCTQCDSVLPSHEHLWDKYCKTCCAGLCVGCYKRVNDGVCDDCQV